ncbi:MAG TPA: hypothetical protein DEB24_06640 [Coriobacteriia bacterium]|nr:hypothetical protein [Coriobacteriia bacterium]
MGRRSVIDAAFDGTAGNHWSAATLAKNFRKLILNIRIIGVAAAALLALALNITLLDAQTLEGGEHLLVEAQSNEPVVISVVDGDYGGEAADLSGLAESDAAGSAEEDDRATDESDEGAATGVASPEATLFQGGWVIADDARYYLFADGSKAVGEVLIDGVLFSFDESGRWLTTRLDVPYTSQYPDMPFGCEVVSVTMMLQHAGVQLTKEDVAAGLSYSPDPDQGFTGSLYYTNYDGLGGIVRPQGIANVVLGYAGSAVDLTASAWETIQASLDDGKAVCMWITTPALDHTVVLTGYSATEVWYNDPQVGKDVVMGVDLFRYYWQQNGQRALSY